jgi:hypothetical protein
MTRAQIAFLTILILGALIIAGAFIWQTARISDTTPDLSNIQLSTL